METNSGNLAAINRRNQQFFIEQAALLYRRAQDTALTINALRELDSARDMGVPIKYWKSFERGLAEAELARDIVFKVSGRKGGRPLGSDALQRVIVTIVSRRQEIKVHQLLKQLRKMAEGDDPVILGVDKESALCAGEIPKILFCDGGEKTAPISGLKDRLYRAKKIVSR